MRGMRSLLAVTAILTVASVAGGAAILDTSVEPNGDDRGWSSVAGYEFTVQVDNVRVGSLGYVDLGQDGLEADHHVALFDSTETMLAEVTVTTSDTLVGYYRFVDLDTSVDLVNGETYRITAWCGGDDIKDDLVDDSTMSDDFTWDAGVWQNDGPESTATYGNKTTGDYEFVGPNFQYTIVPEPATMGLLALGSLAMIRRRKRA